MSNVAERYEKRRLRSSNITVIISISLVLLLLGIFGLIIINGQSYADYIKEQLKIEAFFVSEYDPKLQDKEFENQQKYMDSLRANHDFVKSVKYISKEEATKIAKQELGVDGQALFEENIYPPSVEITLKSDYVDPVKVDSIVKLLNKNPIIDEVINDKELMLSVHENINKITLYLIGLASLFLFIVIVLINNSIRLKIFAKRFSIKTMQLVGARRRFILTPFLTQAVIIGFVAAVLAVLALSGIWYLFAERVRIPVWNPDFAYLIALLIFLGVTIAVFSTLFATWRYLKLRTDQLY